MAMLLKTVDYIQKKTEEPKKR